MIKGEFRMLGLIFGAIMLFFAISFIAFILRHVPLIIGFVIIGGLLWLMFMLGIGNFFALIAGLFS